MVDKMRDVVSARQSLLSSASDFLARHDNVVRIGLSPLVSVDFSRAMLARATQHDLELVLTEMNKADIYPALQSGTIDFGLCPSPQVSTNLRSTKIYSEPLFVVSDQLNAHEFDSFPLTDLADRKILLVPDDCGLSDTVRFLFQNQKLKLHAYEGRALAYHVLEHWAHLGIGTTILPASQVTKPEFACPLGATVDNIVSIKFEAHWMASQEQRTSFNTIMSCLGVPTG
ncbi:transcriptional regulator, LysR family protein [Roseobacter sp. SK209-2-6]|nr:transcriptional regulator, LysR family protein [Roseobacter sp. SK209-2-6]